MIQQQPMTRPGLSNAAASSAANGSRTRKAVFLQVVVAALAAMPTAYAGVDETTTASTNMHSASPSATAVVREAPDGAGAPAESVATAGGALFSPFATTPPKPARRETEGAAQQSIGGADLTFSIAAALAALAAIGSLLRRAIR